MKLIKITLALIVFLSLLIGCSEKSSTGPENTNNTTNGDFVVTIGSGTNPQYSWTAGNAFSLSVMRTSAPTIIAWGIATPGQSNIASSVTHGTVPTGAVPTSISNTENALTSGVEYRVSVTLLDGKTGWTEFTP